MNEYSGNLKKLQEQISIVSDKALIDLINGIQVSNDLVEETANDCMAMMANQNYFLILPS